MVIWPLAWPSLRFAVTMPSASFMIIAHIRYAVIHSYIFIAALKQLNDGRKPLDGEAK